MTDELESWLKSSSEALEFDFLSAGSAGEGVPTQLVVLMPETMAKVDAISRLGRWAQQIRQNIPESEVGWAWVVIAYQRGPLGFLFCGWKGREDLWQDPEEEDVNAAEEWLRLYGRLRSYLDEVGRDDGFGKGDFYLLEDNLGNNTQYLGINNIDIFTPSVVANLQKILTRSFPGWIIKVDLALVPPITDVSSEGMTIHADRIEEAWDKSNLRMQLGDRFKF